MNFKNIFWNSYLTYNVIIQGNKNIFDVFDLYRIKDFKILDEIKVEECALSLYKINLNRKNANRITIDKNVFVEENNTMNTFDHPKSSQMSVLTKLYDNHVTDMAIFVAIISKMNGTAKMLQNVQKLAIFLNSSQSGRFRQ